MSGSRIGGLVAALLVMIGSFLPWATVDTWIGSFSANGTEGDGVITLLLGVAAGVLIGLWKRPLVIVAAVVAGLAALIAAANLIDLGRSMDGMGGLADITPGIGLILTLLASLAAVALAVVGQAQLARAGHAAGLSLAELNRGAALPTTTLPPQPAAAWPTAPAQAPVAPVAPAAVPAGWHPDPSGAGQLRYWDGTRWTEHVHVQAPPAPPAPVAPVTPPPAPPTTPPPPPPA